MWIYIYACSSPNPENTLSISVLGAGILKCCEALSMLLDINKITEAAFA